VREVASSELHEVYQCSDVQVYSLSKVVQTPNNKTKRRRSGEHNSKIEGITPFSTIADNALIQFKRAADSASSSERVTTT
jgi:hypothetical protein